MLWRTRELREPPVAASSAGGGPPRMEMRSTSARSSRRGFSVAAVEKLIDRLLARLSRSRLGPFVRLGRTDPQAPRRHPRRPPPELEQRSRRGAEQQSQAHRPPRIRVPLSTRRARTHPPRLRTSHTHTPHTTGSLGDLTYDHPRRAIFRRPRDQTQARLGRLLARGRLATTSSRSVVPFAVEVWVAAVPWRRWLHSAGCCRFLG